MKTFSNTTEETLVTFHTGRGGRFNNQGHTSYVDQDMTIDTYTDDLFVAYENQREIARKIGDRKNIYDLFEKSLETEEFDRIEKITGIKFGKKIYIDCNGTPVGLDVENDGTGVIDIDGPYNTTVVLKLEDCSHDELLIIHNSKRAYKSSDVTDYVRKRLLEANLIFEESVTVEA